MHPPHNNGSWRFFEALAKNFPDALAVAGVVVHARDITERQQAEERLQRQQEVLAQSEKLAAMGSVLAGVAHELDNPLSVVVLEAGLLREEAKDGPWQNTPGRSSRPPSAVRVLCITFLPWRASTLQSGRR